MKCAQTFWYIFILIKRSSVKFIFAFTVGMLCRLCSLGNMLKGIRTATFYWGWHQSQKRAQCREQHRGWQPSCWLDQVSVSPGRALEQTKMAHVTEESYRGRKWPSPCTINLLSLLGGHLEKCDLSLKAHTDPEELTAGSQSSQRGSQSFPEAWSGMWGAQHCLHHRGLKIHYAILFLWSPGRNSSQ